MPKDLSADVALITDLSILPGERVRQSLIANDLSSFFGLPEVNRILSVFLSSRGGLGREEV